MTSKPPYRSPPPPMRKGDGTFVPLYPMTNEFICVKPLEMNFVFIEEPTYLQRLWKNTKELLLMLLIGLLIILWMIVAVIIATNFGLIVGTASALVYVIVSALLVVSIFE